MFFIQDLLEWILLIVYSGTVQRFSLFSQRAEYGAEYRNRIMLQETAFSMMCVFFCHIYQLWKAIHKNFCIMKDMLKFYRSTTCGNFICESDAVYENFWSLIADALCEILFQSAIDVTTFVFTFDSRHILPIVLI